MLTAAKLDLFRKYNGDIDGWVIQGSPGSDVFPEHEWHELSGFLQELAMYKRNLVSPRYAAEIRGRLAQICVDEDVAGQLMELV